MKMLRDEQMAGLGKLRCGDVIPRLRPHWAEQVGRLSIACGAGVSLHC